MTTVCAWLDLPDTLDAKRLRAAVLKIGAVAGK